MNELLDINEVCANPKKYGFNVVDVTYKGNSIVINQDFIDKLGQVISLSNYIYYDTRNLNDNYLIDGISITKTTTYRFNDTLELKR